MIPSIGMALRVWTTCFALTVVLAAWDGVQSAAAATTTFTVTVQTAGGTVLAIGYPAAVILESDSGNSFPITGKPRFGPKSTPGSVSFRFQMTVGNRGMIRYSRRFLSAQTTQNTLVFQVGSSTGTTTACRKWFFFNAWVTKVNFVSLAGGVKQLKTTFHYAKASAAPSC